MTRRRWGAYPNGWFAVGFSDSVKPGMVRSWFFMDQAIVIWRTEGGAVAVARAQHVCAELGRDGKVEGELLVCCPHHQFSFDQGGNCVASRHGGQPPWARLGMFEVAETNGVIMAWWHAEGRPPEWEPPDLSRPGFSPYAVRLESLSDRPEHVHGLDSGRLLVVHGFSVHRGIECLSADGHRMTFEHVTRKRVPLLGDVLFENRFELYGLGILVADVRAPKLGLRVRVLVLSTPTVTYRMGLWTMLSTNVPVARGAIDRGLLRYLSRDLQRDFPIWHDQIHPLYPRIAAEDGPILEFRRWAATFYTP
ncbi:Rieske 2Fe-2S domain-containing protein [Streptomyces sp. DT2A-34]|uniref:Rieske 2Fe-2S domain-containing protein n=1 Tax=Streptomyces sp. DT2A-34 TaxID=3051182 RepID=UPI00265B861C|nr:Rieske 2Fe-2S domain-containing protein [Streptomyces sp. DT2A-34]MDO0909359.1 Rieske 2Fe-2S domain-containing protein [Streptomyces sp. DT2A-34]